ncbi:MAG: EamA family transporter [Candidatus Woesearchaeota archaeon]
MNYILWSLLADLFLAIVNIVDKHMIENWLRKPVSFYIVVTLLESVIFLIIPFRGLVIPSLPLLLLCLSVGVVWAVSAFLYFSAFQQEEASRVVPLFQLSPIFVLALSALFLRESLTSRMLEGFFLLVFGGILITSRRLNGKWKVSRILWIALALCLMLATITTSEKYIYSQIPVIDGLLWLRIGALIPIPFILSQRRYREEVASTWRRIPGTRKFVLLGNELLTLAGYIAGSFAVALGSPSIVSALGGFQPLFVLVFAVLLSLWLPKVLKEELAPGTLAMKLLAILLMFAGLWLVY